MTRVYVLRSDATATFLVGTTITTIDIPHGAEPSWVAAALRNAADSIEAAGETPKPKGGPRCCYCGWTEGHPPDCRAVDPNPEDR